MTHGVYCSVQDATKGIDVDRVIFYRVGHSQKNIAKQRKVTEKGLPCTFAIEEGPIFVNPTLRGLGIQQPLNSTLEVRANEKIAIN